MPSVAIVQYRLLHYRTRLFESMREALRQHGVNLILVCGQPSPTERLRKDEGELGWALKVHNRYGRLGGKDVVWQPLPPQAARADLVVVMQESRLLSNYPLQLRRGRGSPLVAFWGHGRNYQATQVTGPRERWKAWWLRHVDWWFAYTDSSARYVTGHGFDPQRVTVLQNAIDTDGFAADLASISEADLQAERGALGIVPSANVAIYCGSIYAEKRISLLLEAADLLRAGLPDFHLLVVGEGPQAPDVRAAAASRPWLHVRGIRKGREKALDYRLASVMLNPGLVGLHIVDSFVAGTPLVTQTAALHSPEYDYLDNGLNGLSVGDDSARAYADAVVSIYLEEGRLLRMGERCAADARRYTLDAMASNFTAGIVTCLRQAGRLSG